MMLWLTWALATPNAPPVYATGFRARPDGQCDDRRAARQGRCVDTVDVLELERAWGAKPVRPEDAEAWESVGELFARTWEDLARRYPLPDVQATLVASGFTELPSHAQIWERSTAKGRSYALPRRSIWLGAGTWFDPLATPTSERSDGPLFSHVRYHGPEGQQPIPRTLRLSGRFASRLGYDGKRHDFDLMDGDPRSSGPFFEQMFPYKRTLTASRGAEDTVYAQYEREPLVDFRFPKHVVDSTEDPFAAIRAFEESFAPVTTEAGVDAAEALASLQFERFRRVVSVAAAQYAMQDITRNQMRVLTALTAISTPPDVTASEGYSRDLVAAARGETDTSEEILEQLDVDAVPLIDDGAHLRYERLPATIVEPWVEELAPEARQDMAYFDDLNRDITEVFPVILRPDRPPLKSLERRARQGWLRDSVLPGNDRQEVDTVVLRLALSRMLEQLDLDRRNRIETWMLLDHAMASIATTFDPTRAASPNEVVQAATAEWQVALLLHGHRTQLLPQGLGAVDPTAICSVSDGLEGLDEPTFKRVNIDLLVGGPRGASLDTLLDEAGRDIPFQFIDDPKLNKPEQEALVELGDGRTLYRLRWTVWSGWHLFWDRVPQGAGKQRLMLRTGAVCDDLVLAPHDLASTLIRASLLAANFRPTRPETAKIRGPEVEDPTITDVAGAVSGAPDQIASAQGTLDEAKNFDPKAGLSGLAGKNPGVSPSEYTITQEPLRDEVSYLRNPVWKGLSERYPDGAGLLFVADIGEAGSGEPHPSFRPRTPYATQVGRTSKRRASDEDYAGRFVASGWMWMLRPQRRPLQVAPAYASADNEGDRPPKWSKRNTNDFGLAFGGGLIPWRRVQYVCATTDAGTVDNCAGPSTTTTEAFAFDIQGIATLWRHGRRVTGIDAGAELRLDIRHPGKSWFWANPNDTDFNLTLRPAGGIVLGLRTALRPRPLRVRRAGRATWGTPRADGPTKLSRTQLGVRSSILLGPGFNGLENTTALELWAGRSLRRSRGKRASFTPYHPGTLFGPYVRAQVGLPMTDGADANRFLTLKQSFGLMFGVRYHMRFAEPPPKLPEAE